MDDTFMRHATYHGEAGTSAPGVSGLLTNYQTYQRWVRTTHARSLYLEATFSLANKAHITHAYRFFCSKYFRFSYFQMKLKQLAGIELCKGPL